MKTNKKAISLIVLVVTIIVLAILAATVIISLSDTNIIEQATNTAFKSDMANYKTAVSLYVADQVAQSRNGDLSLIDMSPTDFTTYFNVQGKYAGKLSIVDGELVYETSDQNEITVLGQLGIATSTPSSGGSSGSQEEVILAAGLYETGTSNIIKTWDELVSEGFITVTNGSCRGNALKRDSVQGDLVISDDITKIAYQSFYAWKSLTKVVIPDSVQEMDYMCFAKCTALESVRLPNALKKVGGYEFQECTLLKSIVIPSGSEVCPSFYKCTNLASVSIPDSVLSVPLNAFNNTSYYDDTNNWENGALYIDNHLIKADVALTGKYTVKAGTLSIASYAFKDCSSLTEIELPNTVKGIGGGSFSGCTQLVTINIPSLITTLESNLFRNCTAITRITIPNSVTTIGEGTFSGCTGLTSIELPSAITTIGSSAFSGCIGITSITIPNLVTSIGSEAFKGCIGISRIELPGSVTAIGDEAFMDCTNLSAITVGENVTAIGMNIVANTAWYNNSSNWINGGLYLNKCLLEISKDVSSFTVLDGTKIINSSAFGNYENWYEYSITAITLPTSVVDPHKIMMTDNYNISSITYSGTMAEWESKVPVVNEEAFDGWYNPEIGFTIYCTDGNIRYEYTVTKTPIT